MVQRLNTIVWGAPALLAILGIGLYLTIRSGFGQLTMLPRAIKTFFLQFRRIGVDKINSPYRALCTALAATVGTGNIVGVAGAIVLGGPGSVFWMWICGLLGMVIKFAEATLAVHYRQKNQAGEYIGGPMYMIQNGLGRGWCWLGFLYCVFGVVASFGVGNAAQVNAVVESLTPITGDTPAWKYLIGVSLAVLVAAVLLGGARRVGEIAEILIPFAACVYVCVCCVGLILCADRVPGALKGICVGAFRPKAVTGGLLGSAFQALMIGASRGTFTNEAGMGTASIAHGAASVGHPVEQGFMGILEVFIDTILLCTMTALVILTSGIKIPYGADSGATLTVAALAHVFGDWIGYLLAIIISLFAIATILGWSLYGIRCTQYLLGDGAWRGYVLVQIVIVAISAMVRSDTIWSFSELMNGLMLLPNLTALLLLSPVLMRLISEYKYPDKNLTKRHKKW